jgi:hypothetical protein
MITWYTKKELIPADLQVVDNNDCYFSLTDLTNDAIVSRILTTIDKAEYHTANSFVGRGHLFSCKGF